MKFNLNSLVDEISKNQNHSLSKEDIKLITTALFEEISETLIQKDRVEIRGFGSFSIRIRNSPTDPRKNNNTDTISRKNCNSVYFRMSKNIIDKLKEN